MIRKSIITLILVFATFPVLFSQSGNKIIKDPLGGGEMLYGEIDTSALSKPPFSDWFIRGLETYSPDTETIVRLINTMAPEYYYVIVMGTWCPDSRREVPRMLSVLYSAGVPASHITIYAVDRELKARRTPVRDLDIEKVPTLIVSLKDEEAGRIIESPVVSVEKDLLNILPGN